MAGRTHSAGALLALVSFFCFCASAFAQNDAGGVCPRPAPGSEITSPREIRSRSGVLQVSLALRASTNSTRETRYCYVDENGNQAPTLRLHPGDLLVLKLKNELPNDKLVVGGADYRRDGHAALAFCANAAMSAASTNLHFHGLMIPPACHQDDVLRTAIDPGSASYEYRLRIPPTQPPGLYWYHPHPHGHSEEQVLGGASGALIVEGIERFIGPLAGLPERLLVIRDQIRQSSAREVGPKPPSKDLSVNFVPVPYPEYPPALIRVRPSQRELWRLLNASADTFLELHLLTNGNWQSMGLVAIDGVPLGYEAIDQRKERDATPQVQWTLSIPIPPGGRAEFIFDSPAKGQTQLLTAGVDTVPFADEDDPAGATATGGNAVIRDDDDFTPARWLVTIVATPDAPAPTATLPTVSLSEKSEAKGKALPLLLSVRPTRQRKLYFSEQVLDSKNPRTSTVFYLTEEGHQPTPFNPAAAPNITVHQGDVEDWVLENRSQEAHTFHIHQSHFVLLERNRSAVHENYLRDTVAIPYWDGVSPHYPRTKLRMDFRNPDIVGTFPYHCHILQHEDGGMMGSIQVLKPVATKSAFKTKAAAK
jgi:FtsP/CotA-like multicopper oxidase with cupredoxin domain